MCKYAISICMYCMPWTTGALNPPQHPPNTLSWPRTRGDPLRAPQGMGPTTFLPHPSTTLDPIFLFFLKNPCLDLSCHGHRIGQDTQDRPKLCPIVLPRAWNKTRSRVVKSDIYLWLEGASKMPPSNNFVFWSMFPRE